MTVISSDKSIVKTQRIIVLIFMAILCTSLSVLCYEVDQFSGYDAKPNIVDSADQVNAELNRLVDDAIASANSKNKSIIPAFNYPCDSADKEKWNTSRMNLFVNLRDNLRTVGPVGTLERFAEKARSIDRRTVPVDQSVYAGLTVSQSIVPKVGINSIIRIGNSEIGTDKLGHFLSDGYDIYLKLKYVPANSTRISMTMMESKSWENGEFGRWSTGVFAYADHSANYQGFLFWHKMCGLTSDGKSDSEKDFFKKHRCYPDSYLMCENGVWKRNPKNPIDLRVFIDDSWDESINCNSYDETIAPQIFSQLSRRVYQWKGNPKQPCPRDPKKCLALVEKRIKTLNPICENVGNKLKKNLPIDPNVKFEYSVQEKWQKRAPTAGEKAKANNERDKKFMDDIKKLQEQRR